MEDSVKSDAALARKRRIAMRKQRSLSSAFLSEDETSDEGSNKRQRVALDAEAEPMLICSATVDDVSTKSSSKDIIESMKKKKPHITGIKMQSRYDPGVEMTKDELKAWRKEARRVRNRESAAASRKKNRESIDELELEVKGMQNKYDAALRYIMSLEVQLRQSGGSSSTSFCPSALRQDLEEVQKVSPEGETPRQTVSPPQSPTLVDQTPLGVDPKDQTLQDRKEHRQQERRQWHLQVQNDPVKNTLRHPSRHGRSHPTILNSQKHIIDNTIIRPIACV